jgi:hypothetical protein
MQFAAFSVQVAFVKIGNLDLHDVKKRSKEHIITAKTVKSQDVTLHSA